MEGFVRTNVAMVPIRIGGMRTFDLVDHGPALIERHERMKKAGFKIDSEHDVYVKEGYGAWKTNVDSSIKTIEDLVNYYEPFLEKYIYKEEAEEIKQGYEYVIGPGAPINTSAVCGNGLYLRNYKEIAEKINKEEKGRCKKKGTK